MRADLKRNKLIWTKNQDQRAVFLLSPFLFEEQSQDFFGMPLIVAIIHSIFEIQFALNLLSGIAKESELLPSIIVTIIIIGTIYGSYFLATYFGSKNIIKEEE